MATNHSSLSHLALCTIYVYSCAQAQARIILSLRLRQICHVCCCLVKLAQLYTCACAEVKATQTTGPVLIHIITEKGRGYLPAETASDKMHGVAKYDPITGKQQKPKPKVRLNV